MIRKNKGILLLTSIIILLPAAVGLLLWNRLPAMLPTHWGMDGAADGHAMKAWAVLLIPAIFLAVHWLCVFLTKLDHRERLQNPKVYRMVLWICPVISLAANFIMYAVALGWNLNVTCILFLLLGIGFVVIGNYLPKCRQNRTVGIRMKWTLESEANWNATHRFAGKVWVGCGIALMLLSFLPESAVPWVLIALIIASMLPPVVYSYRFHKQELRSGAAMKSIPGYSKKATVISMIIAAVVLIIVLAFIFSAGFSVEYGETSFRVDAKGFGDISVAYDSILSVEYREACESGTRTFGFGSFPVEMGQFKNDEFGAYTRYTHSKNDAGVVIRTNDGIIVLNAEDEAGTKAIYDALTEK